MCTRSCKKYGNQMLEFIGFCAIGYILLKMAPGILEGAFKFAVTCIGFLVFILIVFYFVGVYYPSGIGV